MNKKLFLTAILDVAYDFSKGIFKVIIFFYTMENELSTNSWFDVFEVNWKRGFGIFLFIHGLLLLLGFNLLLVILIVILFVFNWWPTVLMFGFLFYYDSQNPKTRRIRTSQDLYAEEQIAREMQDKKDKTKMF